MATKKTAKIRGQLPSPQPLAFPESEFSRFWKSKLVELEAAKREQSLWPAFVLMIVLYGLACIVEPCDGHSCDEVTYGTR